LFLHPKQYGLSLPRVDARPAPLRLAKPASIYELAICLGNRGVREGYMRALRNLNPRYEADSWLPTGTTLNATTKIVGLYGRYCTQGPRAELAAQLVRSDPDSAIVRMGEIQPVPAADVPAVPVTIASGKPKPVKTRNYSVQRGETLTSIAQKFQCDTGELAKANDIKPPRYGIRPGQRLRLQGCRTSD
jgi:membrane-bound lytic murein transglycosylase D